MRVLRVAGIVLSLILSLTSCYSSNVTSGGLIQKRKYTRGFFLSKPTIDANSNSDRGKDLETGSSHHTDQTSLFPNRKKVVEDDAKANLVEEEYRFDPVTNHRSSEANTVKDVSLSATAVHETQERNIQPSDDEPEKKEKKERKPWSKMANFSFLLFIVGIVFILAEQLVDPTHPTISIFGAVLILLATIFAIVSLVRNKRNNKKENMLFAKIVVFAYPAAFMGLIVAFIAWLIQGMPFGY